MLCLAVSQEKLPGHHDLVLMLVCSLLLSELAVRIRVHSRIVLAGQIGSSKK